MSVIPQAPRASGGLSPPWALYQGSALDPLGTLSGPQTPRLLTPPPPIPQILDPPLVMETFFYIGVVKRPFSQKNAKYDGKIIFFSFFCS